MEAVILKVAQWKYKKAVKIGLMCYQISFILLSIIT